MNRTERAKANAEALRPLLEEQGLTYTAAGKRLGLSRGSVAGLADRHSIKTLSAFSSPSKEGINYVTHINAKQQRAEKKRQKKPHQGIAAFTPLDAPAAVPDTTPLRSSAWLPLPGSAPKRLSEHRTGECLWAVAENPFRFCCLPVAEGKPYCSMHFAMGNRPVVVGTPVKRAAKTLKGLTS